MVPGRLEDLVEMFPEPDLHLAVHELAGVPGEQGSQVRIFEAGQLAATEEPGEGCGHRPS